MDRRSGAPRDGGQSSRISIAFPSLSPPSVRLTFPGGVFSIRHHGRATQSPGKDSAAQAAGDSSDDGYYEAATHRGVVEWVREHDWILDASGLTIPSASTGHRGRWSARHHLATGNRGMAETTVLPRGEYAWLAGSEAGGRRCRAPLGPRRCTFHRHGGSRASVGTGPDYFYLLSEMSARVAPHGEGFAARIKERVSSRPDCGLPKWIVPRSIWKGAIAFGLVNIPVGLTSAESRPDIQLHRWTARITPASATSA